MRYDSFTSKVTNKIFTYKSDKHTHNKDFAKVDILLNKIF